MLRAILGRLGRDANAVFDAAQHADTKDALRRQTERAPVLGIFGAPSFLSGAELFWGNDRLEDAVAWHRVNGRTG